MCGRVISLPARTASVNICLSQASSRLIEGRIKKHLTPFFGRLKMADITVATVNAYVAAPASVRHHAEKYPRRDLTLLLEPLVLGVLRFEQREPSNGSTQRR